MDNEPKKLRLIEKGWNMLADHSLKNVSQLQRDEMRKAFYIGACAMWDILVTTCEQDENIQLKKIDDTFIEIQEFKNEIILAAKKAN